MTKVNIISGFLGAGKTTLIKKLLKEAFVNEQVVLIENEFGEIGVDGGFMKEAGIEIKEMNSGCICCSLVGDFEESLKEVVNTYHPDRVIIEPSGVGKLSDIIKAVKSIENCGLELNSATAVADAKKCRMYQKNFGEFFNNQIEHASCVILSHTAGLSQEKIAEAIEIVKNVMKTPSHLIENVIERIRIALLNRFPLIEGGTIKIEKLSPPIASTQVESVSVIYEW